MSYRNREGKGKWFLEHLVPSLCVLLITVLSPLAIYHLDLKGDRTAHLQLLIDSTTLRIQAAEDACGPMPQLDAANRHRGAADYALSDDLGKVEEELEAARRCLQEARGMGCPQATVPPND